MQALLKLDPKNAGAYANLGMVEFLQAEYSQAAKDFQQALAVDASLSSAKAFLGMCDLRLGEAERGRALLEESVALVKDKALRVQAGLELVRSYSDSGLLEKAQKTAEDLERGDPDNPELLYTSYRLYSARAAAALQKLAEKHNDSPWLHEVIGQNYMAQEQYAQAAAEFGKALAAGPRLSGIHYQLGEALLSQERTDEKRRQAEEQFRAELELNPGDAESLCKLAQIELDRSNVTEAAQLLGRALASRPSLAEAHATLGGLLERQGDTAGALREFETAERLAPEVKATHYRLSILFKKLGRAGEADRELAAYRRLADVERQTAPRVQ